MNISLENVDKVSAVLTVKMERADYAEKVEAALKNFRKKANMPGFRPGQVPMGLLKKRFGTEITAEEVNKLLGEKLYGYIRENNVNMLGEPLPNEERQQPIDFDTMDSFEFVFDIALAPEINVAFAADDAVPYYNIEITDEMVDKQVQSYRQRAGQYNKVDSYQDKDMVKGLIAELDENGSTKEGGIQVEGAVMLPDYMKNADEKAKFAGCKVNDVLVFNPFNAYEGSAVELSSLLKITKEEAAEMKSDFSYQVTEITRFQEAELNQALFDQVLGEGAVSSEEEFRAKVKESLAGQFVADSDYKFGLDLRALLTQKAGKLEYSEVLMKRIMQLSAPKDAAEDYVEKNYDKSIEELSWHLIKEHMVKTLGIKVEQADVQAAAKAIAKLQFAQYGMVNIPEEMLTQYAENMLKQKDQVNGLVARAIEEKIAAEAKKVVKLETKTVSMEDFNKMFAE